MTLNNFNASSHPGRYACGSGDSHACDVQVRDYSLSGIALESKGPIDVGTRLLISIVGDEGRPIMLSAQVCWQLRSGRRYLVGCSLDEDQGRRIQGRSSVTVK